MSDIIYNSYNYNLDRKFEPLADRKKLKNQPFTQVPQERNEAEAFFTENISSSVGLTKIVFTNKNGGNDSKYSREYLTFTALEDTTFTFTRNELQYSVDGGETWETLAANTPTPTITAGSEIMWKQTGLTPNLGYGIGKFSSTGNFNVSGNIMSLYYGDEFIDETDLTGKNYAFYSMFSYCTNLEHAKNLILPATTLAQNCYNGMFFDCTSLVTAPELPATTLADNCYYNMFSQCTSLTSAPELPATTLAQNCYSGMFFDCTSLTTAPELPAITLAYYCYYNMFSQCTSLTSAHELPATTLADGCYTGMFFDCTSLTTAPELPATTLADNCYSNMFGGCTSLTTAPELPATTLAHECYYNMFYHCTSLSYLDIYSNEKIDYEIFNNATNSGKLVLHGQTPLASQDSFLQQFIGWELWIDDELIGIIEKSGGNYYYN